MAFNLDDYEPVADRIERFWKDHVEGRITTELVHHDDKRYIVKAYIFRDIAGAFLEPDATGYAEETIGSTNVNRTSALENCETSAIGRALANLGYAVKNRASREEMTKAQPEPRPRSGGRKVIPSNIKTDQTGQIVGNLGLPQPQESHDKAPQTPANPETAATVFRIKAELLERLSGDKPKAKMIWRETVNNYGLGPDDPPSEEMLEGIEADLRQAVLAGLKTEVAKITEPTEEERPFV